MVRRFTQASIVFFIFAATLYTGVVSAHGKVELEDDSCMRRIGENMIHLSAYQPRVDVEAHYCTDIPQVGDTLLVVDLVDPALRDMPIGLKVFKGTSETDGELITNISPTYYSDGVISFESALSEKGVYSVEIVAEGAPPLHYRYQLRVEMMDYANVFRAAIGPVVVLLLLSLIFYKVMKSRRRKKAAKEAAVEAEEIAKVEAAKYAATKKEAEKEAETKQETTTKEALDQEKEKKEKKAEMKQVDSETD